MVNGWLDDGGGGGGSINECVYMMWDGKKMQIRCFTRGINNNNNNGNGN